MTDYEKYESERERLATIMDLRLAILELNQEGKDNFSIEEIFAFLDEYAKKVKIHK